MKRFVLLIAAAAAALGTVAASPAHADHHPACKTPPIKQTISLVENGSNLDFAGSVQCLGAASAAITALTLTPLAGTPTSATLTSSASCTSCTAAITASGSAPAAIGVYNLVMNFTVTDAANGRVYNTFRQGRYAYNGDGTIVQVCGHGVQLACPAQVNGVA